jgi:hypothetical protein
MNGITCKKSLDMIALRMKLSYECPLELISDAFLPLHNVSFPVFR